MHLGNVVVLGQLVGIESLTTRWGSCDENLHWIQSSELIELCVKLSDILADSSLGMPWELSLFLQFLLFFGLEGLQLLWRQWDCLEHIGCLHQQIDGEELAPPLLISHSLCWHGGDLTSANTLGNLSQESLLSGLASLVNRKDVRVHAWGLNHHTSHQSSQVNHMDGWNEILTLANHWESFWVLDPSLLEMVIEDSLSISISDS